MKRALLALAACHHGPLHGTHCDDWDAYAARQRDAVLAVAGDREKLSAIVVEQMASAQSWWHRDWYSEDDQPFDCYWKAILDYRSNLHSLGVESGPAYFPNADTLRERLDWFRTYATAPFARCRQLLVEHCR
jgi:hypothetical protein